MIHLATMLIITGSILLFMGVTGTIYTEVQKKRDKRKRGFRTKTRNPLFYFGD